MLNRLLSLDYRRRRLLASVPGGPLRDFLAEPFPAPGDDCRGVKFVALDLETTGLDARKHDIISMGWVCLSWAAIDLSTAQHRLVLPSGDIPEHSAVIHKITDDQAAQGEPLEAALALLLGVLAGTVLIAHHARVEFHFLDAACQRVFGGRFLIPVVDTQALALRQFERSNSGYSGKDLRLAALRDRHNLPRYPAHNALSDALAAAELFVAQMAQRQRESHVPLRQVLSKF